MSLDERLWLEARAKLGKGIQTVVAHSVGTSGIVAVLGGRGDSGCGSDGGEHPVKGRGRGWGKVRGLR